MGKRIKRILKSNSGESIIFVLGVMLILLFIGGSVLVAASAAAGSGASRQVRAQLELYADSIQRVIKHSLVNDSAGDVGEDIYDPSFNIHTSLSGQLMRYVYEQASNTSLSATETSIQFVNFGEDELSEGYTATITGIIINPSVVITEGKYEGEPIYYYDGNVLKASDTSLYVPRSATISTQIKFVVEVTRGNSTVTSVATYNYSGGFLKNPEDTTNLGQYDANILKIETAGEWTLISYEKS